MIGAVMAAAMVESFILGVTTRKWIESCIESGRS